MSRAPRPLAALGLVALIGLVGAGCGSNAPSETGTAGRPGGSGSAGTASTAREKGVRFAQCMRDNGVGAFPDPDTSGELTIDQIANGSSLDPDTAVFKQAISACKDLQPSGFTGHKRSAEQQRTALKFAQCIRDHGVEDFPDPTPDGPLVDTTRIPSTDRDGGMSILNAAMHTCGAAFADKLGLRGR